MDDVARRDLSAVLVTTDSELAATVRRLCAAVGSELVVASDAVDVVRHWRHAGVVLVDALAATELIALRLPARPAVRVLACGGDPLAAWQAAARLGAPGVVTLPGEEQAIADELVLAGRPLAQRGPVVAVLPAAPGAGASVLAVGLAATAAADRDVSLVDLDVFGGGLDLLVGLERAAGARWSQLRGADGVLDLDELSAALPRSGRLALLSCDRDDSAPLPAEAVTAVARAAAATSDLVVLDLPAAPDAPVADVAVALADRVVVVVPDDLRAVAAATSVCRRVLGLGADPLLVIRRRERSRLRPAEISGALGLPVAVTLSTDRALADAADRGDLLAAARRGPNAAACRELLDALRAA